MSENQKTILIIISAIIGAVVVLYLAYSVITEIKRRSDEAIIGSSVSANARSVEGHIDNIEYAIISSSFSDNSEIDSKDGKYASEDSLNLNLPSNDTIKCSNYVIKNGVVETAENCKANGWKYSFNYTSYSGAIIND